jgi:2-succinyl-5-enolpyruvyl-6-hydroxy-3-cyclohexene-1-carboxylate synthase
VAANRGASGIDGTIASAVGFAAGLGRPVTLLVGDLALLHDVGSLAMARDATPPVTIVLIDNGGGGIFDFLPIASHPSVFTPWFDTPQDTDLSRVADAFGLPCTEVADPAGFAAAYGADIERDRSSVIRVASDRQANVVLHRELGQRIATALEGTGS